MLRYPETVNTGIETEIKLKLQDAAQGVALLAAAGFQVEVPRVFERNAVLDDDAATLRSSGRLLRLRQAGHRVTCTFKGPSRVGLHKQREEREFIADDYEAARLVFSGLGYQERFRYEKYRTEFIRTERTGTSHAGLAVLDETPVGCFLELEGEAGWIDATALELGFSAADYLTSSYASLYFEWCAARGETPSNMVFAAEFKED